MQTRTKAIFTKLILLLFVGLLCLPCTAKREFKLAWNLPTAPIEQAGKLTKTLVCASYSSATSKTTAQKKQQKTPANFGTLRSFYAKNTRYISPCPFNYDQNKRFNAVPVYLLHEQYLI